VCFGTPTVSMKRSFTIISVSAEMTPLQLLPNTFNDEEATAYPCDRCRSLITPPALRPWM
jgi:hypothetical protein